MTVVIPIVVPVRATSVECPTCGARIGWACEGRGYGYHAAGYHVARTKLARELLESLAKSTTVLK